MGSFKRRLLGSRNRVIRNGFPELSHLEIRVYPERNSDELFVYGGLTGGGYYICVDEEMKQTSDREIEGGMAHELAHISTDEGKNSFTRFVTDVIYDWGTKYKKEDAHSRFLKRCINRGLLRRCAQYVTYDERRTDLMVVERGYGEQLLAFVKFHDSRRKAYQPDEGLTATELTGILAQHTGKRSCV